MNRRDLLKKMGLGSAVAAAAVVAPKLPQSVAEVLDPQDALGIALPPPAPAPDPLGGVAGAIRHLVRERAHGRPMGYMESEDGTLVHWHAVRGNGDVITGTLDRQHQNYAGKNGLAYYALKHGVNYTNAGRQQYDNAVGVLKADGDVQATVISDGLTPFAEAPEA